MNKRVENLVKRIEKNNGKMVTLRRDVLVKMAEENAFDYMNSFSYDETFGSEESTGVKGNFTDICKSCASSSVGFCYVSVVGNTLKFDCYIHSNHSFDLYIELNKSEEVAPVEEVQTVAANTEYEITQDTHTKTGSIIYVVKLVNRVSKDEFKAILENMKSLGSYYSKFKNGFIFNTDPTSLLIPVVEEVAATEEQEPELINAMDFNDITTLKTNYITNWNVLPQELQGYILSCDRYWIDSQWINLYKENKIVAVIGISKWYRDVEITSFGAGELFQWDTKDGYTLNNLTIEPESIDNTKLVIFIDGEGCIKELTTNNIQAATENLNARILNEYNNTCGGYSKTWITLTYNDNSYRFRYDLDDKTNLATNIIQFMIEQETQELNYTLANREKFSSYMNIDDYEQEKKEVIELLEQLLKENNSIIELKENPYTEAIEQIEESKLYIVEPSHDWLLKDNRLIRNDYMNAVTIATGKAVREFIKEGKGISPFNLKQFTGDLNYFTTGLKKVDSGQLITIFPTKQDLELKNIKMLDRFKKELERVS